MGSQSHLSTPAFLFAGAALLLVSLFAGACDQMTGSSPGGVDGPPEVDSAALSYSHMPMGTSLPSPGEVPLKNGTIAAFEETPHPKNDSSGVESPYGCYLASHVSSDSASFRSIYLYFPEAIVEAAGTETERTVYQLGETGGGEWVRYASCVIPDASGAHSLAQEQIVRSGEEEALQASVTDSATGNTAAAELGGKSCITFQRVELDYCVGGPCCSETYCSYDVTTVTVCRGGGGGGDGGSEDPYPGGGGGGGSDPPVGGDGENCQQRLPEPGSECEPTNPCDSANPPSYCGSDVNENEVCSNDPLKDMDIRPTCAGIKGGRYGEEARTNAQGDPVPHWGLDLGGSDAEIGTEISAIEGGTVVSSGAYSTDFGNYVIIRNGDTWYLYAHLSEVNVEEGSSIDEEKKIGEMGKSGNAEEADCNPVHLHLEVRKGEGSWPTDAESKTRDPEKYVGTEFSSDGQPVSDEC